MAADVLVFHDIIKSDPESRKLDSGRQEVGASIITDLIVTTLQLQHPINGVSTLFSCNEARLRNLF